LKTIAFPAISTGVYGYPKREAAEVAARTVHDAGDGAPLEEVIFCCFDRATADAHHDALERLGLAVDVQS
jgi:O-acetyl-ADP-ribose deacetylase (regulator of RNase III)